MDAVLRVSVDLEYLDGTVASMPDGLVASVWRKGDVRFGGRVCVDSGFAIVLAEGDDTTVLLAEAAAKVQSLSRQLSLLTRSSVAMELDIAIAVGSRATKSVRLDAGLMQTFGSLGLDVVVSAYPCSDDAA